MQLTDVTSVRWAATATVLFAAGLAAQLAEAPPWLWWTLYLGCYVTGGWGSAVDGIRELAAKRLDVDLLMILAAVGAAAIGQIFDGALLIVIFAISGSLEELATRRTAHSVRSLLDLAPDRATRVDEGGHEIVVPAAQLKSGDCVLVRPGERLPGDGAVVAGSSDVDQSSITGEAMPVLKATGDEVFAGTLNGTGVLQVRVVRDSSETVVARIVAMVAEASATKARTQMRIEKLEQRYSVGVVLATLALFGVPLALGAELQPTLLRAMTFMIVASPCALVLATMPPLLSAIANAGRHGVLVKSATVMERLSAATVVVLDKTGTLTEGAPGVTAVVPLDADRTSDEILGLAAAVEQSSEHPLGRAVTEAARRRGLVVAGSDAFRAVPGRGVRGAVDGRQVAVTGADEYRRLAAVRAVEDTGATVVVVLEEGRPVGVIGLTDRLRPDAAAAVAALTELTERAPILLTGDSDTVARRVAAQVGIPEVHAGLLPDGKVAAIRRLQEAGEQVLIVGDGINDAPAMAAADTSIAMGLRGADLSIETADAVTVRDELLSVPAVLALARRAKRVVTANLVIAAVAIAVLVSWDVFGDLPLPLGVAGHEGSTVVVALNGLRLLTNRAWRRAAMP
ncbi:heavy metal translocating P-type ATPase [Mycolicibacterium sp. S2-37]|uniref:heavy metal translocating P-type ATPase n=1 Tax=Mycolicibacterium sp. S2-37 TaxID=2810297 RepID=UPI0027DA0B31|nr:heavy metal translocating P-type ATPase [Mycolicibacterium sp. S2-37]